MISGRHPWLYGRQVVAPNFAARRHGGCLPSASAAVTCPVRRQPASREGTRPPAGRDQAGRRSGEGPAGFDQQLPRRAVRERSAGSHSLLVGGNAVGKSTVCEALDLVLGLERLYRRPVIDEYDFYAARYRG